MVSLGYHEYLASPWWTARRAAVIRYRGYRCERCGLEPFSGLQLHHRTYERLGRELPADVELLCDGCHAREHGLSVTVETWADYDAALAEFWAAFEAAP